MDRDILTALHSIGAIKFGQFEIKRDFTSPFSVDLNSVISKPEIAKAICKSLWEKGRHFEFDLICGVPSIGTMLAGFISWEYEFPMTMKRTDGKEGIQILGRFKSGDRCLVIQDVLLSGQDTLEVIDHLESEGLKVIDTLSFIDMQLGGKKKVKNRGYQPHAVFGMKEIVESLYEKGKIGGDHYKLSSDFLENTKS